MFYITLALFPSDGNCSVCVLACAAFAACMYFFVLRIITFCDGGGVSRSLVLMCVSTCFSVVVCTIFTFYRFCWCSQLLRTVLGKRFQLGSDYS